MWSLFLRLLTLAFALAAAISSSPFTVALPLVGCAAAVPVICALALLLWRSRRAPLGRSDLGGFLDAIFWGVFCACYTLLCLGQVSKAVQWTDNSFGHPSIYFAQLALFIGGALLALVLNLGRRQPLLTAWLLTLVLTCLPFETFSHGPGFPLCACLIVLLWTECNRELGPLSWPSLLRHPLTMPGLAFLTIRFLSVCFSVHPAVSLELFARELAYASFGLVTLRLLADEHRRVLAAVSLATLASVLVAGAIWRTGLVLAHMGMREAVGSRLWISSQHPNMLALTWILAWPFLALLSLKYGGFGGVLLKVLTVLGAMFFLLTYSKSGWIGGLAMLVVAVAARSGWRLPRWEQRRVLLLGGLFAVLLAAWGTGLVDTVSAKVVQRLTEDRSNLPRLFLWNASLKAIADRPLLGFGPSTYFIHALYAAPPDRSGVPGVRELLLEHVDFNPHSLYLDLAETSGTLALWAWLWLVFAALRLAWRGCRTTGAGWRQGLNLAALLAIVGFHGYGLFDTRLTTTTIGFLCWMILGVVGSSVGLSVTPPGRPSSWWRRIGALILASAVGLWVVLIPWLETVPRAATRLGRFIYPDSDPERARCRLLSRLNPLKDRFPIEEGWQAFWLGDLVGAEALFERAAGLNRCQAAIRKDLGWIQWFLGRRQEAVTNLDMAARLDGVGAHPREHFTDLGAVLWGEGRHEEARHWLEQGLLAAPDSVLSRYWVSSGPDGELHLNPRLCLDTYSTAEAQQAMLSILSRELTLADTPTATKTSTGDEPTPLLKDLLSALRLKTHAWIREGPAGIDRSFYAAEAHRHAGLLQEAESIYREIVEQDPTHTAARWNLGGMAYDAGAYEQALGTFTGLGDLAMQGKCLHALGRDEEAAARLEAALQSDPSRGDVYETLIDICQRTGQGEKRLALCRQYVFVTGFPSAHGRLSDALADAGQPEQALALARLAVLGLCAHAYGLLLPEKVSLFESAATRVVGLETRLGASGPAPELWLRPTLAGEAEPWLSLARGLCYLVAGRAEAALVAFRHVQEAFPGRPEGRWLEARALLAAGKAAEAAANCQQLCAEVPRFREAWLCYSDALGRAGQADRAAEVRQVIAENWPDDAAVLADLARQALESGSSVEALSYLRAALRAEDRQMAGKSGLVASLARLLERPGGFPEVEAMLRDWLVAQPDNCEARRVLADYLFRLGRREEALSQYQTLWQEVPWDQDVAIMGAQCLLALERPAEAVRVLLPHASRPSKVAVPALLCGAYSQLGQHESAIEEGQTGLKLFPGSAWAHIAMGNAFLSAGRVAEAIPLLRWVVEHEPGDTSARYSLAVIARRQGDQGEARRLLAEIFERDPEHQKARALLSTLQDQAGGS